MILQFQTDGGRQAFVESSQIESFRSFNPMAEYGHREAQAVIRTKSGERFFVTADVYEIQRLMRIAEEKS